MGLHEVALILATFLCSLVAGFLFAFAEVLMPGIRALGDREFIRAFQAMDTTAHAAARQAFEGLWNRWNAFRTTLSCLATALLIVSVTRLYGT